MSIPITSQGERGRPGRCATTRCSSRGAGLGLRGRHGPRTEPPHQGILMERLERARAIVAAGHFRAARLRQGRASFRVFAIGRSSRRPLLPGEAPVDAYETGRVQRNHHVLPGPLRVWWGRPPAVRAHGERKRARVSRTRIRSVALRAPSRTGRGCPPRPHSPRWAARSQLVLLRATWLDGRRATVTAAFWNTQRAFHRGQSGGEPSPLPSEY